MQPYCGTGSAFASVGYLDDPRDRNPSWCVHQEAAVLNVLRGSDRVSKIHSAYLHAPFAYIVMDQFGIDYRPDRDTLPEFGTMANITRIHGHNGVELVDSRTKTPRLTELQVCKVISHLLEALMFLNDRRMTHQDMSHRNYLVDGDLNVSDDKPPLQNHAYIRRALG